MSKRILKPYGLETREFKLYKNEAYSHSETKKQYLKLKIDYIFKQLFQAEFLIWRRPRIPSRWMKKISTFLQVLEKIKTEHMGNHIL